MPLMGERRAVLIVVLFCFCPLVSTSGIAFASSENWVEVTRFTGLKTIEITTEPFTIEHVEWRIRWNYSPIFRMHGTPIPAIFSIAIYESEDNIRVSSIGGMGTKSENGIWFHNENGTFHLRIGAFMIDGYSIIVEQNLESIPEFPSWIILPLFTITTLAVIIYRNRLRKKS